MRRYAPKAAMVEEVLNGIPSFQLGNRPIALTVLEKPLIFLAIGCSISFIIFIFELLLPYFSRYFVPL